MKQNFITMLRCAIFACLFAGIVAVPALCERHDSTRLLAKPQVAEMRDSGSVSLPQKPSSELSAERKQNSVRSDKPVQPNGDWDPMTFWTALAAIAAVFTFILEYKKHKKSKGAEGGFDSVFQSHYEAYRQSLITIHNRLSIPSSDAFRSFSVPLLDTFVSLRLSDRSICEGAVSHHQQDRFFSPQKVMQLSFENGRRLLLIVGSPGGGKTTLLKYYLLSLLQENRFREFGFHDPVMVFFVFLRDLKKYDGKNEYRSLAEQLSFRDQGERPSAVFTQWLNARASLILLDGLDEISNEDDRKLACEWIDNISYPKARIVVSTRPTGYRKGDGIELKSLLVRADIQGFEPKEQDEFLEKWFDAYYKLIEFRDESLGEDAWLKKRKHEADEKIAGIRAFLDRNENTALRQLARIPLLLQIMAMLWKEREVLPQSRVELYESALIFLLGYRDEKRGIKPLLPARDAMNVLAPVALWMQGQVGKDEAEEADILEQMESPLSELSAPPDKQEFFDHIVRRSGLLVRYADTSQYQFSHKTFCEYLAAYRLQMDRPYENIVKLVGYFGQDWWNEVLRFFIWKADANQFDAFMGRFFQSDKSKELTQDEQNLLERLVSEARLRKIDALKTTLLDQHTTMYQQLYLLKCMEILLTQQSCVAEVKGALQLFLDRRLAKNDNVEIILERLTGQSIKERDDVHVSRYELGSMYMRIKKGAFIYSVTETPVTIDRDLFFARFLVTNKLYRRFIGYLVPGGSSQDSLPFDRYRNALYEIADNSEDKAFRSFLEEKNKWYESFRSVYDEDERFGGDDQPVVGVSWYAAKAYCVWISMLESHGKEPELYCLPTEQEWEWAAGGRRDGKVAKVRDYPWPEERGKPSKKLANYDENEGATTPVGRYPDGATPEGLYDMAGNVWEWMDNRYANDKDWRSLRGGSWYGTDDYLRCSARRYFNPVNWSYYVGFRVVRPSPFS